MEQFLLILLGILLVCEFCVLHFYAPAEFCDDCKRIFPEADIRYVKGLTGTDKLCKECLAIRKRKKNGR